MGQEISMADYVSTLFGYTQGLPPDVANSIAQRLWGAAEDWRHGDTVKAACIIKSVGKQIEAEFAARAAI